MPDSIVTFPLICGASDAPNKGERKSLRSVGDMKGTPYRVPK